MRYKHEYMTMRQIGQLFGVSSHTVGRWLKELRLRTDRGTPSHEALASGVATQRYGDGATYHYVWQSKGTVAALEDAGHERVPHPPPELVEATVLAGPFETSEADGGKCHVVGGDGEVAIVVTGKRNALLVCRVLNIAYRAGMLSKLIAKLEKTIPLAQ